MICFCYFCQKSVFRIGCDPSMTPFAFWWAENNFIEVLPIFFFSELLDCSASSLNPLTSFLGNQQKKELCGFWGKIWAKCKLGPVL